MRSVKAVMLLLLMLFFTLTSNFSAMASYTVGIKAGDWIKYDQAEIHHLPPEVASGNPPIYSSQTLAEMEILNVSGTSLTLCVTRRWSDGTEVSVNFTGDVAESSIDLWVIPANLTYGNSFNVTDFGTITIDEETVKTYAGASRTVVHAYTSRPGTSLSVYWDKQTGVALEIISIFIGPAHAGSPGYTSAVTYKATETNMWQAELDLTLLYVLVAMAIVITVGATIFIMHRRKLPATQPPPKVQLPPSKMKTKSIFGIHKRYY